MPLKSRRKPLPPTQREKKRYLKFRLLCGHPPQRRAVAKALAMQLRSLYGNARAAQAGLSLIDWDPMKSAGILKCARDWKERVQEALNLLSEIEGQAVTTQVLKASGTLKKLRGHARPRIKKSR